MSRDIYVQDIPPSVTSVQDVPDGWMPEALHFSRHDVVSAVRTHAPALDDSDPSWLHVTGEGIDVEVGVADDRPLMSFAFHDRSADRHRSDVFVSRVLRDLGVRAFDPEGSETGIFVPVDERV